MEPYYQDDLVTLYHGDCLTATEWLTADVLVTDPPYGISWKASATWTNAYGGGGHRSSGQALSIANDTDTTARDAALALWGTDRVAAVFGDILRFQPANAVHVLIYAKPEDAGIRGARAGRRKDVEGVYLLGPWPVGVGGKTSVLRTNGLVAGPRGIATRAGHPHAKPIDVLEEIVALQPGTIADPFAGSGSTLLASRNLGRKAIGVELEEKYCELIAKRLSHQTFDFSEVPA